MSKRIKAFMLLIVCGIGIATWAVLQNFDVRGFSLSERESILSIAGRSTSFLFELNPGDYEFTLHRFQNGERISKQIFPALEEIYDGDNLIDVLRIRDRQLLAITINNSYNGAVTVDMNIGGMRFGGIEETGIDEMRTFSWNSIERRMQLGDNEVPLLYMAITDGGFPTSLQEILSENFSLENDLEEFHEVSELFIVTIRKTS